jgi:hypothetical protein
MCFNGKVAIGLTGLKFYALGGGETWVLKKS